MESTKTSEPKSQGEPKLLNAYAVLAEASVKAEVKKMRTLAQAHPETGITLPKAAAVGYTYFIMINYSALIGATVTIHFYDQNDHSNQYGLYTGSGAGLVLGSGTTWGTAYLNYDINSILSWRANFSISLLPVMTGVNLYGMSNEYIGNCIGGGLEIGIGIGGGGGQFSH